MAITKKVPSPSSSSPPSSSSTPPQLKLATLLQYSQYEIESIQASLPGQCCPILWDMREPATRARHVELLDKPLSPCQLSQPATFPPAVMLNVTCEFFPEPWPITVTRLEGVTVGDVLETIQSSLHRRISKEEWERLSDRQREKITEVFETRCARSEDREATRQNGVLRIDCLMYHTWFAGLSLSPEKDLTCILTLRRPR